MFSRKNIEEFYKRKVKIFTKQYLYWEYVTNNRTSTQIANENLSKGTKYNV